ncbi:MAG: glycosyl transferase [Candidatus Dadabacteria bacterium]
MPRVSVIIPTYNRAEFLCSAITSVLNQTFQDFEIIVVDDASNDGTYEVVSSFNGNGIKYIRHKINRGGAAARNTGIRASTGEYIAFLDDDDEWMPEKLQMQVDLLQISPPEVGAVYTGFVIVSRAGGEILYQGVPTRKGYIFNEMLIGNLVGATPSVFLRRECFNRVGLFDENLPFAEDWDMWIRISKEFHFECIEEILVKCYFHNRDKLSVNLEGLSRGIEIMLEKYGHFPGFKKTLSYSYLRLGVLSCYNRNTRKGREAFFKAIRLYPFEIKHYFNLFISLLGADNFRKLKMCKEKVIGPFRDNKSSMDYERRMYF